MDDDEFEVKLPVKAPEVKKTGLDEEEESDDDDIGKKKASLSKPKTKPDKKKLYKEELVGVAGAQDGALDDPLAEKMRRQRLVEESDFELAKECFGDDPVDLEKFIPKTESDFEKYALLMSMKYLRPFESSIHYPTLLKVLLRKSTNMMSAADAKELEMQVGVIRNEKVKAEKPVTKGKKAGKKATLNMRGASDGGDLMAMTEEARYRNEVLDDDYDFM